jgi:zinc protease
VAKRYLGPCRIEVDVVPGVVADQPGDVDAVQQSRVQPVNPSPPPVKGDFVREVAPEVGPTPRFISPSCQRRTLSSGLVVRIVERHELPLVTFHLVVKTGETFTPPGKEGLASITATLLDEGTRSRSGLQIAGELPEIGASLSTIASLEAMDIVMTTLMRCLERSLDLFADVILNPSFPDNEVRRLKLHRLAELEARSKNPEQIADDVFELLLYPRDHPYGRPYLGTRNSVQSITRDDVVDFYRKNLLPGNAELVVVGDVRPDEIVAALQARFEAWQPGAIPSPPPLPRPVPSPDQPLYLIDRPGSAQSIVTIGRVGSTRKSDHYEALDRLSTVLGGASSGRINWNLRDAKGYTYGFSSMFPPRRGPAPFLLTGPVQTSATKDALAELIKEMTNLTGPKTITEGEITAMETSTIPWAFSRFETTGGVADRIAYLVAAGLDDDYYATHLGKTDLVTKAEVDRVAREYLKPELMTILVVGDRARIEGPLKSLPFVKTICLLDVDGKPLQARTAPKSAERKQ